MIFNKESDIEFMKKTAEKFFAATILNDYGDKGLAELTIITDVVSKVYKYINLQATHNIIVYKTFNAANNLATLHSTQARRISDYSSFASLTGITGIVIEIINENELDILINKNVDPKTLVADSIVYQFENGKDLVYGKTSTTELERPPDTTSYFAFPTFKNLDSALEQYRILRARRSTCPHLSPAWFSDKRIFFSPRPEEKLRKSLYDFLSIYVRGEVREEQNVNDSEPVDIKITWDFSSHIALIEVKWMGKSLAISGQDDFNQNYNEARANEGAKQLADYMEENKAYTARNVSQGYLVVFDARRWRTNTSTKDINRDNGFYYEHKEVTYDPEYHKIREDFAVPIRFFIEPMVTN